MRNRQFKGEVLFEFWHVGNSVRVAAIDPVSNTEVVIVGDPSDGQETLERIAMRKLAYVLEKKRGNATVGDSRPKTDV